MNQKKGKSPLQRQQSNSSDISSEPFESLSGKKRKADGNQIQRKDLTKDAPEREDQQLIFKCQNEPQAKALKKREIKEEQRQYQMQAGDIKNFKQTKKHSGYLLYKKEVLFRRIQFQRWNQYKQANMKQPVSEATKLFAQEWKALSKAQRDQYNAQAQESTITIHIQDKMLEERQIQALSHVQDTNLSSAPEDFFVRDLLHLIKLLQGSKRLTRANPEKDTLDVYSLVGKIQNTQKKQELSKFQQQSEKDIFQSQQKDSQFIKETNQERQKTLRSNEDKEEEKCSSSNQFYQNLKYSQDPFINEEIPKSKVFSDQNLDRGKWNSDIEQGFLALNECLEIDCELKNFNLAFYHFSEEEAQKICLECPNLNDLEINQMVCKNWKQINGEVKRKYQLRAQQNKLRYMQQMEEFNNELQSSFKSPPHQSIQKSVLKKSQVTNSTPSSHLKHVALQYEETICKQNQELTFWKVSFCEQQEITQIVENSVQEQHEMFSKVSFSPTQFKIQDYTNLTQVNFFIEKWRDVLLELQDAKQKQQISSPSSNLEENNDQSLGPLLYELDCLFEQKIGEVAGECKLRGRPKLRTLLRKQKQSLLKTNRERLAYSNEI